MRSTAFYFILLVLFSSCTHRIIRTGYEVSKADYRDCNIPIVKLTNPTDSIQKIGEIKLGETGFAVACSEAHAIQILRNEGCAVKADLINIVEENRPDLWSSCYRCTAEFYKFKGSPVAVQSSESFDSENVNSRVAKDRSRNTVIAIVSVAAGIVLGLVLFQ